MFVRSIVRYSWLSAQWQLPANCLLTVSDILYHWPPGWGIQVWTTKAHPPNEVVTVSMYIMPVASSLMIQLALIEEISGVAITPMDMAPRGASEATSTSSGVCRQAVTPAKLCSRVVGHTTSNTCPGEEGLEGVGPSVERLVALLALPRGAKLALLFASKPWIVWGYPQQPPLVRMDGELSPTLKTLGLSFLGLAPAHRMPWGCQQKWSLDSPPLPSWGGPPPRRPPHQ